MQRFTAILGAALLVAVSCAGPGPTTGASPTAEEKPIAGGRVVVGSISDIKTLQPVITTDTASAAGSDPIYSGMTRNNPDNGEREADLASKWEQSADNLTVTWTLRDGLVWSDGTPITGDDYKYYIEAVMRSKKSTQKSSFQEIVGVKEYQDGKADTISGITVSGDGKTITVKLTKSLCTALGNTNVQPLPKALFTKYFDSKTTDLSKNIDDNPYNLAPPVSSGPFKFKEFKPGDSLTLVKNEKYFKGAPLIDEYIIKVYADATAIKAALVTGEVAHYAVNPVDVDELKKNPDLNFARIPGVAGYNFIGWNPVHKDTQFLANKDVRQALWYGINVKAIVDKILLGYGRQALAPTPVVSWSYSEAELNKYPYDVAKAKSLLEKAGAKMGPDGFYRWTDGKTMKIVLETNQGNNIREQIVQIAQEQYKQIGIQIEPLLEAFPNLVDRVLAAEPAAKPFQGVVLGWSTGTDPNTSYSIWHSSNIQANGNNFQSYKSDTVDKALDAGRNGPDCSKPARTKQYQTFDKQINEDAPYAFLFIADALRFSNKYLRNFDPKPYSNGSFWNIEKWWVKK